MTHDELYKRLEQHLYLIPMLVSNTTLEQARVKPDATRWSVLEVMAHLADEERLDFRKRLQATFAQEAWLPIDPPAWVIEKAYNSRELSTVVADFQKERQASLAYVATLKDANWQIAQQTSKGPVTALDLMHAWVAHDLLHIKQITKLHYDALSLATKHVAYAGEWL